MNRSHVRVRWGIGLFALASVLLFSLACGMSGTVVPACENAASSDACSECCRTNGHNGHAYSSMSTPSCTCM